MAAQFYTFSDYMNSVDIKRYFYHQRKDLFSTPEPATPEDLLCYTVPEFELFNGTMKSFCETTPREICIQLATEKACARINWLDKEQKRRKEGEYDWEQKDWEESLTREAQEEKMWADHAEPAMHPIQLTQGERLWAERAMGPKPGTKMGQVFTALSFGDSRRDMVQSLGLSRSEIAVIICNLRRSGYYNKSLEEGKNEWREAVSLANGGVWPAVREYAAMNMSPAEIRAAVLLRDHRKLSQQQVNVVLSKARSKGYLARRTPEEKRDIRKDGKRPQEEIHARVELWLEVAQILKEHQLEKMPKGRADWIALSRFLYKRRQGPQGPGSLFNDAPNNPCNELSDLSRCLEAIHAATPVLI